MEVKEIPDVQLQELIDTLRHQGVQKGRQESDALLQEAQQEAKEIIALAQAKAEAILAETLREKERLEQSGRESLRHASRDLLLRMQRQLEILFSTFLQEKSKQSLGQDKIGLAIATMISNWKPEKQQGIEVLLPPTLLHELGDSIRTALAQKMLTGIEVKADPGLKSGFRIFEKEGHAYYDFSAESIAEALTLFLNPVMSEIVNEALRLDV